ncbi:MAG: 30S ribosomal protein S15 [Nanoarchaeota archaeon]
MEIEQILKENNLTKEKVEEIIIELAKQGKTTSEIGAILRDQYGIYDVRLIIGKKLKQFLKEKELYSQIPEDLKALFKRYLIVEKHLSVHKKDKHSKRGLRIIESKIKRLINYYKEKGELDPKFRFNKDQIALYLK